MKRTENLSEEAMVGVARLAGRLERCSLTQSPLLCAYAPGDKDTMRPRFGTWRRGNQNDAYRVVSSVATLLTTEGLSIALRAPDIEAGLIIAIMSPVHLRQKSNVTPF